MRDTVIADKLLMFIVYETAVPIPIPLFCNKLGIDYKGLLGIDASASWSFPEPTLEIATLFGEASGLWGFVSDSTTRFPTAIRLPFTIGESYIALPPYLGKGHYVGVKGANVFEGDAANLVAHVANGVKFFSLYEALLAIPIEKRIGARTITLGPLAVSADWIVCTAREFHDSLTAKTAGLPTGLAPLAALAPDDKRAFLAAAASDNDGVGDPKDERRLVILLAGGVAVDRLAGLRASFALVSGGRQGFFTSVHISGALANAIAVDLKGSVFSEAHDASGNDRFVIKAMGQILVARHPLLAVAGEARSTNGVLTFSGSLHVLPGLEELHFSAEGHASFSAHAFEVGGKVHVAEVMGMTGSSSFTLDPQRFQCTEDIEGMFFGLWSGTLRVVGTSLADRKHLTVVGNITAKSLPEWEAAIVKGLTDSVVKQLDAFEAGIQKTIRGYKDQSWVAWTVNGSAIQEAELKLLGTYVLALRTAIVAGKTVASFAGNVVTEIAARLGPFAAVVPFLTGGGFAVSLTNARFTASLDEGLAGKVTLTVAGTIPGSHVGPWTFVTDLRHLSAVVQGLIHAAFVKSGSIAVV
jgi:hypothetical protein